MAQVLQKNFQNDTAAELGQGSKDEYAPGFQPKTERESQAGEKLCEARTEQQQGAGEVRPRPGTDPELPAPWGPVCSRGGRGSEKGHKLLQAQGTATGQPQVPAAPGQRGQAMRVAKCNPCAIRKHISLFYF